MILFVSRMTVVQSYICEKLSKTTPKYSDIPPNVGLLMIQGMSINSAYTSRIMVSNEFLLRPIDSWGRLTTLEAALFVFDLCTRGLRVVNLSPTVSLFLRNFPFRWSTWNKVWAVETKWWRSVCRNPTSPAGNLNRWATKPSVPSWASCWRWARTTRLSATKCRKNSSLEFTLSILYGSPWAR